MRSLMVLVNVALLCIVVKGDTLGVKDEDLMDCINYMMCHADSMKEFRNALKFYAPKTMDHFMMMIGVTLDIPDAVNNDESWTKASSTFCTQNEEGKKEMFTEMGTDMAEFWGIVCDNGEIADCEGIQLAVDDFTVLLTSLIAQGKCGGAAIAMRNVKAVKIPGFGK